MTKTSVVCGAIRTHKCRSTYWLTIYMLCIIQNPPFPPPAFFKGGRVNFNYLPHGGGKILKREWKWAGVFKGDSGGWHLPYSIFSRFIIFTFNDIIFTCRNYFTLCFAKLCYAFEEKLFFTATIILCNKVILR